MIPQALAVNGAKVYIVGRSEEKLETVAKQYNGEDIDGEIIPLQADVSKKGDIASLYDEISKREKCLCILVNNAGISGLNLPAGSRIARRGEEEFVRIERRHV
jgi:short-subunit dehydrogenase